MFKNVVVPPWIVMWALAGAVFVVCKGLTWWIAWRRGPVHGVAWWRHAAYLLAWPGLDAVGFLTRTPAAPPTAREWTIAAAKTALGLTLVVAAAIGASDGLGAPGGLAASSTFGAAGARALSPVQPYVIGWIGMIGLTLTLHFGLFHLLSCAWRRGGVDARPLMDRPLAAESVSEFWGRRWNTAFRDFTHRCIFRPLTPWLGTRGAILGGFVFSGVVHDLVISVPARGGYGGPTLFFACQGLAMFVERSAFGRRVGLGHGLAGRAFTAAVLLLPLYGLFHPPFVERIVIPFMEVLGAL